MKMFTRYYSYSVLFVVCLVLTSCFSAKNVSNDFMWKNKKFKETYPVRLEYSPEVTTDITHTHGPWFYNLNDTVDAAKNYKVRELLESKMGKRNMVFKDSSAITLRIDKLLFKEYDESVTVNNESGSIGDSYKDYFIFEISGSLLKNDSVLAKVNVLHEYNNEPQESSLISGMIVIGGKNARADKMIENSMSLFSYRVYKAITEPEKAVAKNK